MKFAKKIPPYLRIAVAGAMFAFAGLAFSGFGGAALAAVFARTQFAPALSACASAFTFGAAAALAVIALSALLFGRFYCAAVCPFGILQDIAGFLSRRKARPVHNFAVLRYAVAGLVFGLFAAGWTTGFRLLDPYSNAGRIAGAFLAGGFLPLLLIAALAVWKKRLFCTAVCPVGTLLGLLSKKSVFRLEINDSCIHCGQCSAVCPAGCVDGKAAVLDNERCVRCLNCLGICPKNAVGFHFAYAQKNPAEESVPADAGRRAFLIRGGMLFAGLAAGFALAKAGLGKLEDIAKKQLILPPGAGNAERFAAKCTACQLCTANCPAKIIVPPPGGAGPVSIDLTRGEGACRHDCRACSEVCPTGALAPLALTVKQKTRIALAAFDPTVCIVFQEGEPCGKCASVCPTGAVTLRKTGAPRFQPGKCIGCGACAHVCPAKPEKAMTVHPVERQTLLTGGNA